MKFYLQKNAIFRVTSVYVRLYSLSRLSDVFLYMTEIPKIKFGCRNQLTPGEGAHQIGINRIRLKILSVECFLSDKKLFIICNLVSSDI